MFDRIPDPTADALHAVMARVRADARPHRIDLGVGVYRDETGRSPVMAAVKEAEARLVREEDTKAYQSLQGDERFLETMAELVLGENYPAFPRTAAIQGTGGTGALRIALELAKVGNPGTRVHLGLPSWPNHASLVAATGLELVSHRYFDVEHQRIDWEALEGAARAAAAGDLFLLHGPCHNPTGADLSADKRARLISILAERGVIPLLDVAYYGLGEGLEADLAPVRALADEAPRALIAVACSKSFGLYRERTGTLFAVSADPAERVRVQGQMESISRTLVSMPPAHGAATVATILGDSALRADWADELEAMRQRMLGLRAELEGFGNVSPLLCGIAGQRGIFRMLPLTPEQTEALGCDHAIHMAPSGRINIAGLKPGDAVRLAEALAHIPSREEIVS